MSLLAIILARAGSVRLPGKNVASFHGRPLVAHSIASALELDELDVAVSSDCDEVLAIARDAGAHHVIRRPPPLATATATSADAAMHVIEHLGTCGRRFERVMLLQPTSPLRTSVHIREAITLFNNVAACSLVSVAHADTHAPNGFLLRENHVLERYPDDQAPRSCARQRPVALNGAIYLKRLDSFLASRSFAPSTGCVGYYMASEQSIDVDTAADLAQAELLYEVHFGPSGKYRSAA